MDHCKCLGGQCPAGLEHGGGNLRWRRGGGYEFGCRGGPAARGRRVGIVRAHQKHSIYTRYIFYQLRKGTLVTYPNYRVARHFWGFWPPPLYFPHSFAKSRPSCWEAPLPMIRSFPAWFLRFCCISPCHLVCCVQHCSFRRLCHPLWLPPCVPLCHPLHYPLYLRLGLPRRLCLRLGHPLRFGHRPDLPLQRCHSGECHWQMFGSRA
mmetsp:Transcript_16466/g.37800  ORF Transcript_16466/g.37800 Transcript_16466/m.37800 type:complete len:207 (-) Transcript_16466:395-1015(-)